MAAAARRALLLIDFQRDFLRDDGRMPIAADQREPVIAAANRAVVAAKARGDAVIAIGNEFPRGDWGNFFRRFAALVGSDGAIEGARYFAKWRGDAFCNPDLGVWLNALGVRELTLAGVYAGGCVSATARGALARGYSVAVLSDAVADRSDAARARALKRFERAGATIAATGAGASCAS
jgi:nicotinamidase-related amidase